MRNAGRKQRSFSRNFRFPDAVNGKKSTLKFFHLYPLTLYSALLSLDRRNHPSFHHPTFPRIIRHFLVLVSTFLSACHSIPLSLSLLSLYFSLRLPILSPILLLSPTTRTYTHIHAHAHMHTPSSLRLNSRYRSMF